jgi:CRISPR RNA silencing complex Cmr2 subunit-like protein
MPVLTGIDITGIQRYIFGSNRLRDVISCSWLVEQAISNEKDIGFLCDQNALLAAGGNAILQFDTIDDAKKFTKCYTRRLYENTPGLDVAITHLEYSGKLATAIIDLKKKLDHAKFERFPSIEQLGLSVTVPCQVTGLPAAGFDRLEETWKTPLSRKIIACQHKETGEQAKKRWDVFLSEHLNENYSFPDEIDQLGRSMGDTSLIGVVHLDGNEIGERIKEWFHVCIETNKSDELVKQEYQEISKQLRILGNKVLQRLVNRVIDSIDGDVWIRNKDYPLLNLELYSKTSLPIRPILLGGDDLTFVCDGRIALDLATTALSEFENAKINFLGKISACAGVAIVHSHHPFIRAYELAERLCENAKQHRIKEMKIMNQNEGSWIDWHIGLPRPGETIQSVRQKQYQLNEKHALTCRPYRLGEPKEPETWRWLSETVLSNQQKGLRGNVWKERRNKVKDLMELSGEGPEKIKLTLEAWNTTASEDNELALPDKMADGFIENRTPLLDAIELLDIHLPLPSGVRR